MTKIRALTHPDGTPVRQYGQDIVETSGGFDEDTLDAIRSLVDEEGASDPLPPRAETQPRREARRQGLEGPDADVQISDAVSRKITGIWKAVARKPEAKPRRADVFPQLASQDDALRPMPRPSILARLWHGLAGLIVGAVARIFSLVKAILRSLAALVRAVANLLLWFVWRAVVIVGFAVLVAVCVGPDKVASSLTWSYERYHETNPQIADRLRGEFIRAMSHLPWASTYMPRDWVRISPRDNRSS